MNEDSPRHVAIIMDGNGRWARKRRLPRYAGHRAGVRAARAIVEECARRGVGTLTLFAFSSENWQRPAHEVRLLLNLFVEALDREIDALCEQNVRLQFIGQRDALDSVLRGRMREGEERTQANTGLNLVIALAYGGRWDIARAAAALARDVEAGRLAAADVDDEALASRLSLAGLPDPDLFIRTGGEQRISNFLLWNLAYTELYFTPTLWPDFDAGALQAALDFFRGRERRFGRTTEQLEREQHA